MKIKAAVLRQINQSLSIEELSVPELKPGQVLVKIAFSGVCGSQLNEIRGRKGEDKFLPHTLGHEGSGIVEKIGPFVTKVKIGQPVVLTWIKGEGMDVAGTSYKSENGNSVNSGAISTFMDYAVVSENRLVPISAAVSLKEAALLGCAFPTGAGFVFNTLKAEPKNAIVVIGLGGIGMSAVMAAQMAGCGKIFAVDLQDWKLDFARKIGATDVINPAKENPVEKVKNADFVIESAGTIKTMEIGLNLIHDRGTVVIAGNLSQGQTIKIDPFELIKGKKIIGSWGGETRPDHDIPFYADKILSGALRLGRLISHEFKIEEINQAMELLEEGKVVRALVKCES